MSKRFIMTAFAQDRIGVVADITEIIYEKGCNLEDTEMTQLEDEFAIILLFTGQGDNLEADLIRKCRRLEKEKGISVFVRELGPETARPKRKFTTHQINAESIDQIGIIYKISKFLALHSCNISKLHSERRLSPKSGTPIYKVEIYVEVPLNVSMEDLIQDIEDLGHEMDISLLLDGVENNNG